MKCNECFSEYLPSSAPCTFHPWSKGGNTENGSSCWSAPAFCGLATMERAGNCLKNGGPGQVRKRTRSCAKLHTLPFWMACASTCYHLDMLVTLSHEMLERDPKQETCI